MTEDRNAQALRALLAGPLPAKEISAAVGWAPRTAGPKLHALERAGLVRKREQVGEDNGPRVLWVLTKRGAEVVAPRQLNPPGPAPGEDAMPAADLAEPEPERPSAGTTIGPTRLGKRKASVEKVSEALGPNPPTVMVGPGTEAGEGPWPSLRAREGGVDPVIPASLNLSGWLFLLRAAHSGASGGNALRRKRVDAELAKVEAQLELTWCNGRYETSDGTTVNPEKLAYLKHQL